MIAKGQVVAYGVPQDFINELQGKVWRRSVPKEALPDVQAHFNVISSRLVGGRPLVHVFAEEQPDSSFTLVDPGLEDVYFHRMSVLHEIN